MNFLKESVKTEKESMHIVLRYVGLHQEDGLEPQLHLLMLLVTLLEAEIS